MVTLRIRDLRVTGDDGGVVEQVEQTQAVPGEDDLLLGALDGGEEFG